MRWLAVSAKRLSAAVAIAGLLTLPIASVAMALDTAVGAVVCGGSGATIVISQPQNDSVISQPVVTLSGTVQNATQIEIRIDDQYVSTVPVGFAQLTYSTAVSIPEGTHTLKLVANDVCQANNDEASIVITYTPATDPSDGGSTPTDLDSGGTTGGVTVGASDGNVQTGSDVPSLIARLQNVPIIGGAVSFAVNALNESGLDVTGQDGLLLGVVRVCLTVIAVAALVFAGSLAPLLIHLIPGLSETYAIGNKHRIMMYTRWVLRLAALPLLLIVYFL